MNKSFQEIRKRFPSQFLVLIDTEERTAGPDAIEVVAAREVHAFETSDEMFAAYKYFRKRGIKVRFCPPQYQGRFVVEQIPTIGIFSS